MQNYLFISILTRLFTRIAIQKPRITTWKHISSSSEAIRTSSKAPPHPVTEPPDYQHLIHSRVYQKEHPTQCKALVVNEL